MNETEGGAPTGASVLSEAAPAGPRWIWIALGAATMATKGDEPQDLRARVTSPNGTTHAAIVAMQENGFGDVIAKAMTACRDRAVELGKG